MNQPEAVLDNPFPEAQPPEVRTKTTRERILERLAEEATAIHERIERVKSLPGLDDLDLPAYIFGAIIDFDTLSHPEVIRVIKAIGGKWDKTPSGQCARIDYQTEVQGQIIRCWAGEPPPNCKIVEVDEIIPAQPERIEKKRKLVCQEAQPA